MLDNFNSELRKKIASNLRIIIFHKKQRRLYKIFFHSGLLCRKSFFQAEAKDTFLHSPNACYDIATAYSAMSDICPTEQIDLNTSHKSFCLLSANILFKLSHLLKLQNHIVR